MNMLKQAVKLWNHERKHNGTSLQRRLIAFFAAVAVFIILTFTALLIAFGITGSERNTVYHYTQNELSHLRSAIGDDFGKLSIQAVSFSNNLATISSDFFQQNQMKAKELSTHPEFLEPLLSMQIDTMLSVMERNTCGGVFVLLDATIQPDAENEQNSKAGIFLKKTQPSAVQAVGTKIHYLRGPAEIAREQGIELLGQWKMEYDITGEAFFNDVMKTARQNPELPLSRLYYWTGRVTLKGNSESGFLLCVPVRSADGTVFGVCGMEVSDRMFKQLYSPEKGDYGDVFMVACPSDSDTLFTANGMIAGNYFLTGNRIEKDLAISNKLKGFCTYANQSVSYGGLHDSLRLYPAGSPYESSEWSLTVMMPRASLDAAITGNSHYLFAIVIALLIISLCVSVFISRHYLRPVTEAFDTIKNKSYHENKNTYLEINDLMDFLAKQDEEQKNKKITISETDADITPMFEGFLKNVKTLSPAERSVFDLYIKGYKAQDIANELYLSINTIKTHNRRIFTKLNVSSRKELLVYIDMMKEMNLINEV